jgi:ketosteroid isomerase-like protein
MLAKTLFPVLSLGLLAACASSLAPQPSSAAAAPATRVASSTAPTTSSTRDARLATLDGIRTAAQAKDAHAIASFYADDAVVERFGPKSSTGRAAIEDAARTELSTADQVTVGFGRVWLKGDVLVAEETFNATVPGGKPVPVVGETGLDVMWFDANGKIAREHDYFNQGTLSGQMKADPDALPVPAVPTSMEVHDGSSADDAKAIAWTNDYETKISRSDAEGLAEMSEHISWRCTLGFSGETRDEMAHVLAKWRAALPDQQTVANQIWPVEDYVIVEETLSGKQAGKLGPFEATNNPITMHFAEIWQLKDGVITRGWSYGNFREIVPQLTGAPAPSSPAGTPCTL